MDKDPLLCIKPKWEMTGGDVELSLGPFTGKLIAARGGPVYYSGKTDCAWFTIFTTEMLPHDELVAQLGEELELKIGENVQECYLRGFQPVYRPGCFIYEFEVELFMECGDCGCDGPHCQCDETCSICNTRRKNCRCKEAGLR